MNITGGWHSMKDEKNKNLEVPKESIADKAHSLVKGAIGGVPMVGALASEVFGMIVIQPITKRREQWMESVVEALIALEIKIKGFEIESLKENEEFISFLMETSQIAAKTHQNEKLKALRNALSNFFICEYHFDKKFSFIKVIEDLTPGHIHLLQFLFEHQVDIQLGVKGFDSLYEFYNDENEFKDKVYFRKCIRDLEVQSLIRLSKDFTDFAGGGGIGGYATDSKSKSVNVLKIAVELLDFIKEKN